jgi:2-carboxy-1,4-naphthoquinone phytyltransferase
MTSQAVKPNNPPNNSPSGSPDNQADYTPAAALSGLAAASLPDRSKLWMAAIKPPMYCVAVMPIGVGSAVAYVQTGIFHWGIFLTFALSAVLLLVWENLSNDVFDAATGIDKNKHHSLVNLTRNRSLIFWIANGALVTGIAGTIAIALWQKDSTAIAMVLACCLLGYLYQGPPFRLGYQGLGEILCFLSFGPLAVGAAYYAQVPPSQVSKFATNLVGNSPWSWQQPLLPAAILVGIATTLVLFCSHFHQVSDDLKAGKKSPIVRLGTRRGAQLLPWACGTMALVWAVAIAQGAFPISTLIMAASVPAAYRLCRHVLTFHAQPERVSNSKFLAIHFHVWSGLLLVVGLLLG